MLLELLGLFGIKSIIKGINDCAKSIEELDDEEIQELADIIDDK